MPKLVGHRPQTENKPIAESPDKARLLKISYAQKKLLPQNQVYYRYNESDRGGPRVLAKRWYEWYVLPENVAHAKQATQNMRCKALPLCHLTF